MNFQNFDLKPEVLKGIEKLGYTEPTKIQQEVILESVNGKNIIGQSQTGTGKTAAFVISLLQKIDTTKPGVQALILAPTRELVTQIKEEIHKLSSFMHIRSLGVYGGDRIGKQIDMLRKGQSIVVGTPGRTIDLIERGALRTSEINYFVLDEADRMLDMGFIDDIDFIWGNLNNLSQTMAFSATITEDLKNIIQKYLGVDYTFIKATNELTVDKIDHSFVEIPHIEKYDALKRAIITNKSKRTIVFVETKRDTELLAKKLYKDGFSADFLNGDMRQRERFAALRDFQEGKTDIFIVTDVAARGINVKNIELVINYNVPRDPESYIHRIGRTGRAGAEGKAVMFVDKDESFAFKNIEKRNKITIKQTDEEGNEIERKKEERRPGNGRSRNGNQNYGRSSRFSRGSANNYRSRDGNNQEKDNYGDRRRNFDSERKRERISNESDFDRPRNSYFDSKPKREDGDGTRRERNSDYNTSNKSRGFDNNRRNDRDRDSRNEKRFSRERQDERGTDNKFDKKDFSSKSKDSSFGRNDKTKNSFDRKPSNRKDNSSRQSRDSRGRSSYKGK